MTARAAILGRLRSAAGKHLSATDGVRLSPAARGASAPAPRHTPHDRLTRFLDEASAVGVECHVAQSEDEVRTRVKALTDGRRTACWDLPALPFDAGACISAPIFGDSPPADLARADVGVTGCDAAIAETGSLVLFSGQGKSRLVSLLPPVHVALLDRNRLCFTMAEFFAWHADRLRTCTACTVITGPSRTADIELTLTLGMHGPARVVVIVGP